MGITVRNFLEAGRKSLSLEIVAGEKYLDRPIPEQALNRPGLALAGFFQYFAHRRIQVLGLAESAYLKSRSRAWPLPGDAAPSGKSRRWPTASMCRCCGVR